MDALAPGGVCMDNASVCHGIQYTDDCQDIDFINQNYPDDGKCPAIGCDGVLDSELPVGELPNTIGYYSVDADGDGWGSRGYTWLCSDNADGYALDSPDWNDSIFIK